MIRRTVPMRDDIESWGRLPRARHEVLRGHRDTPAHPRRAETLLPFGLGRSYGDNCLNDQGALVMGRSLGRFIAFDRERGILRCEAGISLAEILNLTVPAGWFIPVSPGTRFVTLGGAIANDIHGKNHHCAGTFGCHVRKLELLRSDGERISCAPDENADWYRATIGGMGLTGMITWAEIGLRRIESAMIEMESVQVENLDAFLRVSRASDADWEYTVSWLDCLAAGPHLGRGIFMRGNHAPAEAGPLLPHAEPKLRMPLEMPDWLLNPLSIRAFNWLYYNRLKCARQRDTVHYEPFFYPLDKVDSWNSIYGPRGFYQYQFVVPFEAGTEPVREIMRQISSSGEGSFLGVLKTFGDPVSPGMLSFPRPGITIALDFANRGRSTLALFRRLDAIVSAAGGRLYPAKDACMKGAFFRHSYPQWERFAAYIDPRHDSSQWRRYMRG